MSKKKSTLQSLIYVFGISSFATIAAGCIGFYSALGIGLGSTRATEVKVPTPDEKVWNIGKLSWYAIIAGFGGLGVAVATAYTCGTLAANKENKEKLIKDSHRQQNKASYIPSMINSCKEEITVEDASKKVYMFRFIKNEQIASGDRLIVLGDVRDGTAFIANVSDEQANNLMSLFDCVGTDEIVGKAFTSYYATAEVALGDFLERQNRTKRAVEEGYTRNDFDYCIGCVNHCAKNSLICPLHEEGWYGDGNCPDRQISKNYPMAPYEDPAVMRDINKRMRNSAISLSIYDDGTVLLWDDVTNRRFSFDWFGNREILKSDYLDLPNNLEAYLEFFSRRKVDELKDYSVCIDEFAIVLKGIGFLEIRGKQQDIYLTLYKNKDLGIEYVVHEFNKYGYPKYPYQRWMPMILRPHLVQFIDCLYRTKGISIQKV